MDRRLLSFVVALGFLCFGCAADYSVADTYAPAENNRLVVYTSHKKEVYAPIIREFETRTGIWVKVVTGGTSELLEQIQAETDNPRCDVMFGGGVESLAAYQDCFAPFLAKDSGFLKDIGRSPEHLWTPFSSLPIVLIYNTRLVAAGQLTGWSGLLDPYWKGRIAFASPTISGSSYTAAITLMSCLPGDKWVTLAQFANNLDGNILSDSGDIVESVQSGACYIGVTLEETALKGKARGANIELVYPSEGTSAVPDGSALISGAPHPENAKAFLDFVISYDVQELLVSSLSRRSVRSDLREPVKLPSTDLMGVVDYDVFAAGEEKAEFLQIWQQLTEESK